MASCDRGKGSQPLPAFLPGMLHCSQVAPVSEGLGSGLPLIPGHLDQPWTLRVSEPRFLHLRTGKDTHILRVTVRSEITFIEASSSWPRSALLDTRERSRLPVSTMELLSPARRWARLWNVISEPERQSLTRRFTV